MSEKLEYFCDYLQSSRVALHFGLEKSTPRRSVQVRFRLTSSNRMKHLFLRNSRLHFTRTSLGSLRSADFNTSTAKATEMP